MKRTLQIRKLKPSEDLRRAPSPCDVITDILDDLAALPTTNTDYGNILCGGAAIRSTFMFYSRCESSVSCRLRDMDVDAHSITFFVNREKTGHRKRRDGLKPLLLRNSAAAVPTLTALQRRFVK
eukprot:jgi/Tetstr1/466632/TSEL_011120.t1